MNYKFNSLPEMAANLEKQIFQNNEQIWEIVRNLEDGIFPNSIEKHRKVDRLAFLLQNSESAVRLMKLEVNEMLRG